MWTVSINAVKTTFAISLFNQSMRPEICCVFVKDNVIALERNDAYSEDIQPAGWIIKTSCLKWGAVTVIM
jgi:hypothetical protein